MVVNSAYERAPAIHTDITSPSRQLRNVILPPIPVVTDALTGIAP